MATPRPLPAIVQEIIALREQAAKLEAAAILTVPETERDALLAWAESCTTTNVYWRAYSVAQAIQWFAKRDADKASAGGFNE